jgi:3-methyladenine DNA glycosylase AlkD
MTTRRRPVLAAQIEVALAKLGSKSRARGAKAYLKSDLDFLGVPMPRLRSTVLRIARGAAMDREAVVATVEALWSRGIFELRAAAVEVLIAYVELLGPDDARLLERLIRDANTWALVDAIAPHVMGALVVDHPGLRRTLDRWAGDDDFWVRRAAMLALLIPLRRGAGDFERFGRYADAMLEEREFFIRKAIGWILREVSRRRPDLVYDWLLPRAARASGLTVREATKHLPAPQRRAILASRTPPPRRQRAPK